MKKRSSFTLVFCLLVISSIIGCTSGPQLSIPADAKDIAVTNIRQVNFHTLVNSNLAWIPNEKNSIAAIVSGFGDGDIVRAYDLGTSETKDLYNLKEYGIGVGNGITFFWSADGKRIVTSSGGVVDLKTKSGHWIKPPEASKAEDLNVLGISADGKTLLVDALEKDVLLMNADSSQYNLFNMSSGVFSARFGALAWSADSKWIAAESYDPDHLPKDAVEALNAPQALYLLRADGKEARLIARNIEGRIDAVTFSSDGSKVVWVEMRKNGDQHIYIANVDGSGAHKIYVGTGLPHKISSNLVWSPDGSQIVFVGTPDKDHNYPFWVLTLGDAKSITPTP